MPEYNLLMELLKHEGYGRGAGLTDAEALHVINTNYEHENINPNQAFTPPSKPTESSGVHSKGEHAIGEEHMLMREHSIGEEHAIGGEHATGEMPQVNAFNPQSIMAQGLSNLSSVKPLTSPLNVAVRQQPQMSPNYPPVHTPITQTASYHSEPYNSNSSPSSNQTTLPQSSPTNSHSQPGPAGSNDMSSSLSLNHPLTTGLVPEASGMGKSQASPGVTSPAMQHPQMSPAFYAPQTSPVPLLHKEPQNFGRYVTNDLRPSNDNSTRLEKGPVRGESLDETKTRPSFVQPRKRSQSSCSASSVENKTKHGSSSGQSRLPSNNTHKTSNNIPNGQQTPSTHNYVANFQREIDAVSQSQTNSNGLMSPTQMASMTGRPQFMGGMLPFNGLNNQIPFSLSQSLDRLSHGMMAKRYETILAAPGLSAPDLYVALTAGRLPSYNNTPQDFSMDRRSRSYDPGGTSKHEYH